MKTRFLGLALLAVPLRSGGLLLIDRDDLHAGGLGVPLQVRHLAFRALALPRAGDAGVDYGLAHIRCSPGRRSQPKEDRPGTKARCC